MTNEQSQQISAREPIRYCFFMTGNSFWFDVAKNLSSKGIAEPVLWLGDDRHYEKAKSEYGNKVLKMLEFVHRPYRFRKTEYAGQYADFFLSDNYLRAKDICIKMMDRLDLYGVFNRLDREVYFHEICIWALSYLENENPDALLMVERPHSHAQYLIYEICLYLNIKVVHFVAWAMLPLNYLHDVTEGQNIRRPYPSDKKLLSSFEGDLVAYVAKLTKLAKSDGEHEPSYMRHQRLRSRWWVKLKDAFRYGSTSLYREVRHHVWNRVQGQYNPINPYEIGVLGRWKIRKKKKANLANSCRVSKEDILLSKEFVYFPLHYEPERTTNPDGGKFHDHFLALTELRKILPSHIDILIKEHPSQFLYADKGSRGRSPLFYELIKNIRGVHFIGTNGNSIELIKKSVFVATITGSVGLEAAVMGKKCITFGHTWYRGCPNIFNWTDKLSFADIDEAPVAHSNEITQFLRELLTDYSVPCLHNPSAEIIHSQYISDGFNKMQQEDVEALLGDFFSKFNIKK